MAAKKEENYKKYVPTIDAILRVSKLEEMTTRKIRKAIEALYGADFTMKESRNKVNELIVERYNFVSDNQENEKDLKSQLLELQKQNRILASQLNQGLTKGAINKRLKGVKVKTKSVKSKQSQIDMERRMVGIYKPSRVKPGLRDFLQCSEFENRPRLTKLIWKYIKEQDLQNPEDKREVISDAAMSPLFGERFSSFAMAKILTGLIEPISDAELDQLRAERLANSDDTINGSSDVPMEDGLSEQDMPEEE